MTTAGLLFTYAAALFTCSAAAVITEYIAVVRFDRLDGTTTTKEN
ncbi:MAG: hypothetical protein ABI662_09465 [Dermatophilaceae bacterium]